LIASLMLIAYAAALALAAAIPGPGVAALVGQSMGNGQWAEGCPVPVGGYRLGRRGVSDRREYGACGNRADLSGIFLIVKVLGGAYLVYLALKLWRTTSVKTEVAASKGRTNLGAFLTGFSVTMGNPKTIVFYLALLPTVMDLKGIDLAQWELLLCVTVCVLIATLAPYAILAARARGMLSRPGALDSLNRIASGIIGATGMLILGQAVVTLARRT
jgi:threonine/homoserine/homoserine lactone efflux protein